MRIGLVTLGLVAAISAGAAAQAQSQTSLLHDALHLASGQEEAWRAYQRAVAGDPQEEARQRQTQALLPSLPTPRRLALIRAQMESDMAAFDQRARATRSFDASLSPQQQHTFDRQTAAGSRPPPP